MALVRELEPEVMDTPEEARDYDAMDHAEVNGRFCDDALAKMRGTRMLDVGTGTAAIPIEICRRRSDLEVHAIDLAMGMLAVARRHVEAAGLSDRIHLERRDAKATGWGDEAFDTVISNSIVHHIPGPRDVFGEMWRLLRPGGVLFVRDLERPASEAALQNLVATYAPIHAGPDAEMTARSLRQRGLFEASLRAALTIEEVSEMVQSIGISRSAVSRTSDRHWTLARTKD